MRKKILLGATEDKIMFAEFDTSIDYVSVCFDTVEPFVFDMDAEYDLIYDYFEEYVDYLDDSERLSMLDGYDCCPSKLAEKLSNDAYDLRDVYDCSLYNGRLDFYDKGVSVVFVSSSCGQCGQHIDELVKYTVNKKSAKAIKKFWEDRHLKSITDEDREFIQNIIKDYENVDEKEWIKSYVEKHYIN